MRFPSLVPRLVSGVLFFALSACRPSEAGLASASLSSTARHTVQDTTESSAGGAGLPALSTTHTALWWLHPTGNGGVSACIGPVVEDANVGPVRIWTLTYALAGTTSPMGGVAGAVSIHSADPLRFEGSFFTLEVRPLEGLLWEDVRTREDLQTLVLGLG